MILANPLTLIREYLRLHTVNGPTLVIAAGNHIGEQSSGPYLSFDLKYASETGEVVKPPDRVCVLSVDNSTHADNYGPVWSPRLRVENLARAGATFPYPSPQAASQAAMFDHRKVYEIMRGLRRCVVSDGEGRNGILYTARMATGPTPIASAILNQQGHTFRDFSGVASSYIVQMNDAEID